ncbi:unnamed protein product [Anisakis simplex]|uniref:DUF148 domain-containing protein n=1 Tax=Anisakis simplex TaxID=6269 RepID=A0A0M3K6V0_ANISI|nr:unnamed protein product [Anisakis simplex]
MTVLVDLPPGFADVLPTETVAKLRAIHQNDNLTWQQKHQQIDAIMNSLPPEILDRLPAPPGFSMLPAEIQAKFKAIQQHSGLNWQQRHAKILEIMQSMTPDQRMLLPPAPPSSPPISATMNRSDDLFLEDLLIAIVEHATLFNFQFQEKFSSANAVNRDLNPASPGPAPQNLARLSK